MFGVVVALQTSVKVSIKWSQFDWNRFERVSADGPFFFLDVPPESVERWSWTLPGQAWFVTLVNSRCVPDALSGLLGSCRIRRSLNWTEPHFDPKPFNALWSQRRILKRPLRVGGASVQTSEWPWYDPLFWCEFLGRLARMLLPPPPTRKATPGFFQVVFLQNLSMIVFALTPSSRPDFAEFQQAARLVSPAPIGDGGWLLFFFCSFSREVTRKSDRRLHPGVTPVSGAYLLPGVYTRFFNSRRPDRARQRSVAPVEVEVKEKHTHTHTLLD